MNLSIKKKGQKELTMIISLIILLVVAVVTISLFLQFFGKKPPIGEKAVEMAQFEANCQSLCNDISNAVSETREDAIWDYCTYTKTLQKSDYADIVIRGAGELSFCRDGAHCFNVEGGRCTARGYYISPKLCLETMCKLLISAGKTQKQAENLIKERMPTGSCNLRQGATIKVGANEKVIDVPTWWEKYFENPDCSGTTPGPGPNKAKLDEFCANKADYTAAYPDHCVTQNYVIGRTDVPNGPDGDPIGGDDFFDDVIVNGQDLCPNPQEGIFCYT